jgi:hypothetical protein
MYGVNSRNCIVCTCTVELHLTGLIGTQSHPEMQKIRIIEFFFENRLHWQFDVTNFYIRLFKAIYLFT